MDCSCNTEERAYLLELERHGFDPGLNFISCKYLG